MSFQTNFFNILNATSLQESESGPTPSGKQDGPTPGQSGQDHALASLSARQAKAAGLMTSGTYGPHGSISSSTESDRIYWCLANKLRHRTASLGSTLYYLTWKPRTMPSGHTIYALRASAPRKSGNASISQLESWPTPRAADGTAGPDYGDRPEAGGKSLPTHAAMTGWSTPLAHEARLGYQKRWNGKKGSQKSLTTEAVDALDPTRGNPKLAGWSTPTAEDKRRGVGTIRPHDTGFPLPQQASMSGWPTPTSSNGTGGQKPPEGTTATGKTEDGRKVTVALPGVAQMSGWPSPAARDHKDTPGMSTERPDGRARIDQLPRHAHMAGWPTPTAHQGPNMGKNRGNGEERNRVKAQSVEGIMAGWGTPTANPAGRTPEQFVDRKVKAAEKGANIGISVTDINMQSQLASWPTPAGSDGKRGGQDPTGKRSTVLNDYAHIAGPVRLTVTGVKLIGYSAGMGFGGPLNPYMSRWLMGLPRVWDQAAPRNEK